MVVVGSGFEFGQNTKGNIYFVCSIIYFVCTPYHTRIIPVSCVYHECMICCVQDGPLDTPFSTCMNENQRIIHVSYLYLHALMCSYQLVSCPYLHFFECMYLSVLGMYQSI